MNKSANGAGTIYKRSDGRWEARYTYTDVMTGKVVRKSIYGKTQKEVRQKLTEKTSEVDKSGSAFEPSKMTLAQWLDIWLEEFCPRIKPSTRVSYDAVIRNHLKPALGDIKLAKLTPTHIQHYYNSLSKTESKSLRHANAHKMLSAKTIKNHHGVLSKALVTAVKHGYIAFNPAQYVELPKVEKAEIKPLSEDQVSAFIKAAQNDEYGRLLQVILFTGLRESEAIGLTWDCVDYEKGLLTINKQLQKPSGKGNEYVLTSTKNGKVRYVSASPYVLELLRQEELYQKKCRLAAGELWHAWNSKPEMKHSLCFLRPTGEHVCIPVLYSHFKKLAESIGVPDARVHDLRHTFAVISLQCGDDQKTVQDNLGHATASFTLDVYGHVTDKMKQESAARMQNYIDKLLKQA